MQRSTSATTRRVPAGLRLKILIGGTNNQITWGLVFVLLMIARLYLQKTDGFSYMDKIFTIIVAAILWGAIMVLLMLSLRTGLRKIRILSQGGIAEGKLYSVAPMSAAISSFSPSGFSATSWIFEFIAEDGREYPAYANTLHPKPEWTAYQGKNSIREFESSADKLSDVPVIGDSLADIQHSRIRQQREIVSSVAPTEYVFYDRFDPSEAVLLTAEYRDVRIVGNEIYSDPNAVQVSLILFLPCVDCILATYMLLYAIF